MTSVAGDELGFGFGRTELLTVSAVVAGLVLFGYADLHERLQSALVEADAEQGDRS